MTIREYARAQQIPREWTAKTSENIQREFERIYRILRSITDGVNDGSGSSSSGGGAPTDAEYVLGASDPDLTNGRVVTNTADIDWDLGTVGQAQAVLASRAALSVIGNPTNAGAVPIDIVAASASTVLKRNAANALVFDKVDLGTDTMGTVPSGSMLHDFLSATHPDTVPAAPEIGSVIVGVASTPVDLSQFWLDGQALGGLSTPLDPGDQGYWLDGAPDPILGLTLSEAVWQKLTPTTPDTVLTFDGSTTSFQPLASALAGARAYRSSSTAVTGGAWQALSWSAAEFDTGFWVAGSPTRFTVPTGKAGTYLLIGSAFYQTNAVVTKYLLGWRVNGSTVNAYASTSDVTDFGMQAAAVVQLAEGDYVECVVDYTSGAMTGRTISGGASICWGSIVKVG